MSARLHSPTHILSAPSVFASRWRLGLAGALVAALLAGCGSSVKLDENVPVSDRSGVPVDQVGAGGGATGLPGGDPRGVTGVQAGADALGQPPKNLARVIYFDYDDFSVRAEFGATLEGHARFLNADRQRRVVLEGHTDERGGREYNLALGQKRADAVRRSLTLLGVAEAQVESVSFGKEKPANPGADEEAYRLNRRVELSYR
ncbi:peptidoglycan-associated lipoprotein Pal [Aquabacterium sp. A08]|uniref:peptidoglycan-associated lipoprotein Pal n=1 Tax=Aquabacterium sp. A08 TaxID=2718532 RepID=UPI00141F8E5F|nr:peptidoglycan-associated lipoprotein Pal [Aquabacterium sp. A08]NIC40535.1 peptidoglycan-associated lipoprotein Pal [Aquabacterium sp. A08]